MEKKQTHIHTILSLHARCSPWESQINGKFFPFAQWRMKFRGGWSLYIFLKKNVVLISVDLYIMLNAVPLSAGWRGNITCSTVAPIDRGTSFSVLWYRSTLWSSAFVCSLFDNACLNSWLCCLGRGERSVTLPAVLVVQVFDAWDLMYWQHGC